MKAKSTTPRFVTFLGIALLLTPGGTTHAATTITESGRFVTVDLEDFLAGTLIGDNDLTNLEDPFASDSPSISYQPYEDLGDFGSDIVTTGTPIGFTIDALDNGNGQKWASLYDTDRRLYYTDANNKIPANETRVYDDIDGVAGRDDSSVGEGPGGEDPDLEIDQGNNPNPATSVWEGGNIALDTRVGNMVIVQENISNQEINAGRLRIAQGLDNINLPGGPENAPDDQGNGGRLVFTFEADLVYYEFIWVDLENASAVDVTFRGLLDAAGNELEEVSFTFADLEDQGIYDQDAVWGDRHINEIMVDIEDPLFSGLFTGIDRVDGMGTGDAVSFRQVDFDTGNNSGGVTQFAYRLEEPVTVVPEPSTILSGIILAGLAGLAACRRHRPSRM